MGGLTAQQVLELTHTFSGDPAMEALQVLLLQEIITEPGVFFAEGQGWVVVFGKNADDWRGTAVAYKDQAMKHTDTRLLPGGIATTLSQSGSDKPTRYVSGHIPHHATIEQASRIMGAWEHSLKKARVVLGFDANEAFTDPDGEGWRAHTGRGEAVLLVLSQFNLEGPLQDLHLPTYHPYNTAQRPRRLDYVLCKGMSPTQGGVLEGSRHQARSDHDLVWIEFGVKSKPQLQPKPTWGARRFAKGVDVHQEVGAPPPQMDTHRALNQLALRITEPGRGSEQFRESSTLRQARRRAQQAPQHAARDLWKQVAKLRKKEFRQWHGGLVAAASQSHWGAYRTLNHYHARVGWQHGLTDDPQWKMHLRDHFSSIFAKAPAARTRRRLGDTRQALTRLCKHQPWRPFTGDELQLATRTWKNGKAAGPDGVTHEILRLIMQQEVWAGRVLHMLNDFLYKGELPPPVLQGATILLLKTQGDPTTWSDTRPITLSSAVLKWFSQLLLLRGGNQIQDGAPLQWAARGKQAPELLVVLRRVVRHAKEWGVPTWIVKLDVRKAFDSVWQESMGDMVASKVGGLRAGGGGTAGGMPWEARAWLGLLEAREMQVAVGDSLTSIPQSNGVRQGSPDSPILFSRIVADCLEEATKETQHMLASAKGPPPPQSGGAFMDDTYIWSHGHAHLQATLASLERRLARHGLLINPGKRSCSANLMGEVPCASGGRR